MNQVELEGFVLDNPSFKAAWQRLLKFYSEVEDSEKVLHLVQKTKSVGVLFGSRAKDFNHLPKGMKGHVCGNIAKKLLGVRYAKFKQEVVNGTMRS